MRRDRAACQESGWQEDVGAMLGDCFVFRVPWRIALFGAATRCEPAETLRMVRGQWRSVTRLVGSAAGVGGANKSTYLI